MVLALSGLAMGCTRTPATLIELPQEESCRRTVVVGPPAEALEALESDSLRQRASAELAVEWRLPPDSVDLAELNAWCAAVGPAVVGGWGDTASTQSARPVLDTLWLVSWNMRVGAGDLRALVADLREGRLTRGAPAEHFVVVLQEAYRGGEYVPEHQPGAPAGSGIHGGPPEGAREDIVALAERLGLWLVYVPSMRNGEVEDRGNAILSTLPLSNPVAVALPVARQRRVAVVTDVFGRTGAGRDWALQVASVHLESSPVGWTSDEEQRLEQADALLELLPEADAAIAAGDYNTKTRGREEALVPMMEAAYPDTPPFPEEPTYRRAFGLYRAYLDYIFFRLPGRAAGDYRRVPRIYNSDHYPLVGWVAWE
ncbi:MAG: endonuclease/exonuclease/phosphatase family protein [Gemmatimonadota bacterium]